MNLNYLHQFETCEIKKHNDFNDLNDVYVNVCTFDITFDVSFDVFINTKIDTKNDTFENTHENNQLFLYFLIMIIYFLEHEN